MEAPTLSNETGTSSLKKQDEMTVYFFLPDLS